MRINCDAQGYYWYCYTCHQKGRHTDERANAATNGERHLLYHRRVLAFEREQRNTAHQP